MKHNRVLNRPMFNPNVSAYGRGITTNLVTEQERQKFNSGGRVGLWAGAALSGASKILPWALKYAKANPIKSIIGGVYSAEPVYKGATSDVVKDVASWAGDVAVPDWLYNPEAEEGKSKWFNPKDAPPEEVIRPTGDPTKWIPEVEEKVDVESDVIDWTPEEKTEKKGQIQLALAERLISGARDPLGSTKQQKNLAGMFGDIRKITDKEDLRKWKRRYDAEADAYVKKSKEVAKLTRDYDNLIGANVQPGEALYRSTGIQSKTIPSKATDKKGYDKAMKNLKPGDVVSMDNIWYVMTPDKQLRSVEKEQIIEINKSGDLKKWKETAISETIEKS